jgi:hypothetical protein
MPETFEIFDVTFTVSIVGCQHFGHQYESLFPRIDGKIVLAHEQIQL